VKKGNISIWISALAVVISLFSLYEAYKSRVANVSDVLTVSAEHPRLDSLFYVSTQKFVDSGVVKATCNVLISNQGASTISITEYGIYERRKSHEDKINSEFGSGLYLDDLSKEFDLPILLESGRSLKAKLVIGIIPSSRAYNNLLECTKGQNATIEYVDMLKLTDGGGRHFYDLLLGDAPVETEVEGVKLSIFEYEPVYILRLHTSRGTVASTATTLFENLSY